MRAALVSIAIASIAAGVVAVTPTAAVAAPGDSLTVAFRSPQTLAKVDPRTAAVSVTLRSTDCSAGCDVYRVGRLRMNYREVLVGSTSFPTQATARSYTVGDTIEKTPGLALDWHYEVRRAGTVGVTADADLLVVPETAATLAGTWAHAADLSATETMTVRSTAAGAAAVFPSSGNPRHVGIVAAKGPAAGVLAVEVAGTVVRTVDLTAPGVQARVVVASLDVPAGAEVRLVNATPAGRAASEVSVDGLVQALAVDVSGTPTARAAAATAEGPSAAGGTSSTTSATGESVAVLPAVPQTLSGGPLTVAVTAKAFGCPQGCRLVATNTDANGNQTETVLRTLTSPASTSLQTLTARTTVSMGITVRLEKAGTTVVPGSYYEPATLSESSFAYSDGFDRALDAAAGGGETRRSTSVGAGATYRVSGTFEGRPVGLIASRGPAAGVVAVYADGVLVRTVDLASPTEQPRQLVAAVQLPLRGRITVVDATPADRAGAPVSLDGLVLLDAADDWY